MWNSKPLRLLAILGAFALVACSDDEQPPPPSVEGTCTGDAVGTSDGCEEGLVCAEVQGGEPACFAAVQIEGRVFDSLDDSGIEGASVVALDANGGAQSTVVFSGEDGTYELPVPVPRSADGTPLDLAVTLRVSAAGYQSFPTPPRTALPVQLSSAVAAPAVADAGAPAPYAVVNAATDVALIPLSGDFGQGTIEGSVDGEDSGGVLVIAEVNGVAVSTAITDADGSFTLFNVPDGDVVINGYRAGLAVVEQTVTATLATADAGAGVVLEASTDGLSTVTGSVQIVNPGDCNETSVILVVESTFVENAARGETPAGLRAGGVTGDFSISGVPAGRYVVLAAFENDDCVRDPDTCIAGTDVVHISVPQEADIPESFKITGALAVSSPGANEVEIVSDANPTFVWEDDSSEEGYEVRVFDALGELVHEEQNVPNSNGATASYQMTGVALEPGMMYQFRAFSWRRAERCFISSTEDLKGVFSYQP